MDSKLGWLVLSTTLFGGGVAWGIAKIHSLDKQIKRMKFYRSYHDTIKELEITTTPPGPDQIGAIKRLYRDKTRNCWVDAGGKAYPIEVLGVEPLDVYYGFGEFTKSDIIADLNNHAVRYGANAYALSESTLWVHRNTALAVLFLKILNQEV